MGKYFKNLSLNFVLGAGVIWGPAIDLPSLHVDKRLITVSGVSAGGIMATQLMVAYSEEISGAAAIGGVIYGCAEGSTDKARGSCMKTPGDIAVQSYVRKTISMARQHEIAPVENLRNHRFFIFNGTKDQYVNYEEGKLLLGWAQQFISARLIQSELTFPANHGFPTVDKGLPCGVADSPWINKCGYDTAGVLLQHLYQQKLRPGRANYRNLYKFQQYPFNDWFATMSLEGFVYIPSACKDPKVNCGLHVALHGCMQRPVDVNDAFIMKTGYNDWAEANGLIVLYPSVEPSLVNPRGCWDWWGYTGSQYLTRKAPQIQSLMQMIHHLAK